MPEALDKTITETGKATRALTKIGDDLVKALGNVQTFVATVESLNDDIEMKTAKLSSLDKEFAESLREKTVDLGFKIKENEDSELAKLLGKRKVIAISQIELDTLTKTVEAAEEVRASDVAKAIKETTDKLQAENNNALVTKDLMHKAATAEAKATLEALASKITYLTEANAALSEQLTAERTARVTIAQNSSQPTINVGTGTGRA